MIVLEKYPTPQLYTYEYREIKIPLTIEVLQLLKKDETIVDGFLKIKGFRNGMRRGNRCQFGGIMGYQYGMIVRIPINPKIRKYRLTNYYSFIS